MALRGLGAAKIPQIDAAALQQLRQRLAARAEHAGVAECLAAARHGDGLVQALAARVLRVAGRVDGLARAAEMVDGVDMIEIERTKVDDVHRKKPRFRNVIQL